MRACRQITKLNTWGKLYDILYTQLFWVSPDLYGRIRDTALEGIVEELRDRQ